MIRRPSHTERMDRIAGFLPIGAGVVLLVVAIRSTLQGMGQPIGPHDEGLLLTNAMLMAEGYVPYRDFYTNYPPGIYLAIIALWKVLGVSVTAERILGFGAHAVLALVAGRFAGLLCGNRFSAFAAGMVLLWLAWLGTVSFAWLVALGLAMIGCLLLLRALEHPTWWSWLLAGAAFGAVGCFRHDLLVYLTLSLLGLALATAIVTRTWRPQAAWARAGGWLLLGAAVPLALVWGPAFARAGLLQPVDDTYLVLVRHVMPARALSLPPVLDVRPTVPAPLWAPAFLMHNFEGAVALTLIGPLVALLWVSGWGTSQPANRTAPALLLALSVAVLPQMVGRTDVYHALYTVTPSIILLCALVERLVRSRRGIGVAAAIVLAAMIYSPARTHVDFADPAPQQAWQRGFSRYGGLPEPEPAREQVLAFVATHTEPGDPIFVGLDDHRRIYVGEMDLYYLADRPGATRVMQFDPNLVNREEVQRRMVEEIEARGTKVAILSGRFPAGDEPNESVLHGSSYLDDYLRAEYEVLAVAGPYRLLLRRDPSAALPPS